MTVTIAPSDLGSVAVRCATIRAIRCRARVAISQEFFVNTGADGRSEEYNNVIKGLTNGAGELLLSDVPAGEYRYLVQATAREPLEGVFRVEPGTEPQALGAILVRNLVNVDFSVVPTTFADECEIALEITYATNLTKPALYFAREARIVVLPRRDTRRCDYDHQYEQSRPSAQSGDEFS